MCRDGPLLWVVFRVFVFERFLGRDLFIGWDGLVGVPGAFSGFVDLGRIRLVVWETMMSCMMANSVAHNSSPFAFGFGCLLDS